MKGITKFAEYSISGGLLWLNILLFITLLALPESSTEHVTTTDNSTLHNIMDLWAKWLTNYANHIQTSTSFASLKGIFNTLTTSLFILLIFCTGLMLDLLSPYFCTQIEVYFFKNSLKTKDNKWFPALVKNNEAYLQDDVNRFINEPLLTIKSPKVWREQKKRYNRINTFLLSYLYANSNHIYLTELTERIRLWYTSRSITTSLIILCVLLNFLSLSDSDIVADDLNTLLYTIIIPLFLLVASYAITVGAYCRASNHILALAYHIQKSNNHAIE